MSEKQEKVWVVMRWKGQADDMDAPVKVFDDRSDARAYVEQMKTRSRKKSFTTGQSAGGYWVVGVKK